MEPKIKEEMKVKESQEEQAVKPAEVIVESGPVAYAAEGEFDGSLRLVNIAFEYCK